MVLVLATQEKTAESIPSECSWLAEARDALENTTDDEIVVDISALECIRSRELNDLIRLHLDARQQGRTLVLAHPQHLLFEVFTLTRLNRLITVRDPIQEDS